MNYRKITLKKILNKVCNRISRSKIWLCYQAKIFRKKGGVCPVTINRIVFLCQYFVEWNSLRSVFEEYKCKQNVDVWIISLPKQEKGYYKKYNDSYEKLKMLYGESVIDGYKNGIWFDLKKLRPDVVFYFSPYNGQLPKEYQISTVHKFAKTCYIPYGYEMLDYHGTHLFDPCFYAYLDALFVCHSESQSFYEDMYKKWHFSSKHYIFDAGCPRFDILCNVQRMTKDGKFTILWIPRWTVNDKTKGSHFLQYAEPFFGYVTRHPELNFVLRPHPLMFSAFVNEGLLTLEEVDSLKRAIDNMKNCFLDENTDYLEAITNCDLVLADFSSMLAEIFMLDKPVIYMDNDSGLYQIAKQICCSFYKETDWEHIETRIEKIMNGIDEKKEERWEIANQLNLSRDGSIAKEIVRIIGMK